MAMDGRWRVSEYDRRCSKCDAAIKGGESYLQAWDSDQAWCWDCGHEQDEPEEMESQERETQGSNRGPTTPTMKRRTWVSMVFLIVFSVVLPLTCWRACDRTSESTDSTSKRVASTAGDPPKGSNSDKPVKTTPDLPELSAQVRFVEDGTVAVSNGDTFDWTEVKINLNPGIVRGGYEYRTARIRAGTAVNIPWDQFTKGDGTRFDIFEVNPETVSISARTPYGFGRYYGGWH